MLTFVRPRVAAWMPRPRRVALRGREARRLGINLAVGLLVAALVLLLNITDYFTLRQAEASDGFFQTKVPGRASHAVLVAVDEKTLAALKDYGRFFSWPRSLHARVIDNLVKAKARVIVLDVLFDARSDPHEDATLVRSIAAAKNVIQPVYGDESNREPVPLGNAPRYRALIQPLPEFARASLALGHANQVQDADGTVRKVPLLIDADGQSIPALPLVAVAKFLRRLEVIDGTPQPGFLPIFGHQIPVDGFYRMSVNWLGPPGESGVNSSVPQVSYVDVLNDTFDHNLINNNAIVFLGTTAAGFADDYWVPTAKLRKMPGVEIHAQTAETILGPPTIGPPGAISSSLLYADAPAWLTAALIVGAALLMALGIYALSPVVVSVIGLSLLLLYLFAAQLAFNGGTLLNLITPPMSLALSFAALTVNRVLIEEREQRMLKTVFSSYVPSDVVAALSRDPEQLKRLGGERREITVLFCDIKGFTSLSETMEPEAVSRLMNQYLTAMTKVIFEHKGTVDKYIGDAVMAFWNAPQPESKHALLACQAALKMQQVLAELSEQLATQGLPRLRQRVGINTGYAAVGNMGSALRVAYTALGDTVNLAARLEPLNNEYGSWICLSLDTLHATGDATRLITRPLDRVTVKGKSEPVLTYELLGEMREDGGYDPALAAMLERYNEGWRLYRERAFAQASVAFSAALEIEPEDGPSQVFLKRCAELAEDPPEADWDGVFVMKHK